MAIPARRIIINIVGGEDLDNLLFISKHFIPELKIDGYIFLISDL